MYGGKSIPQKSYSLKRLYFRFTWIGLLSLLVAGCCSLLVSCIDRLYLCFTVLCYFFFAGFFMLIMYARMRYTKFFFNKQIYFIVIIKNVGLSL